MIVMNQARIQKLLADNDYEGDQPEATVSVRFFSDDAAHKHLIALAHLYFKQEGFAPEDIVICRLYNEGENWSIQGIEDPCEPNRAALVEVGVTGNQVVVGDAVTIPGAFAFDEKLSEILAMGHERVVVLADHAYAWPFHSRIRSGQAVGL